MKNRPIVRATCPTFHQLTSSNLGSVNRQVAKGYPAFGIRASHSQRWSIWNQRGCGCMHMNLFGLRLLDDCQVLLCQQGVSKVRTNVELPSQAVPFDPFQKKAQNKCSNCLSAVPSRPLGFSFFLAFQQGI